jgi:hypothetical protein
VPWTLLDYAGFALTVGLGVVLVGWAACVLPDLFGGDDSEDSL